MESNENDKIRNLKHLFYRIIDYNEYFFFFLNNEIVQLLTTNMQ